MSGLLSLRMGLLLRAVEARALPPPPRSGDERRTADLGGLEKRADGEGEAPLPPAERLMGEDRSGEPEEEPPAEEEAALATVSARKLCRASACRLDCAWKASVERRWWTTAPRTMCAARRWWRLAVRRSEKSGAPSERS